MNNLGAVYLKANRWADAEPLLRECLELRRKVKSDIWLRFHTMSQLGAALAGQKRYAEAEPLLVKGHEGLAANEAEIPVLRKKDLIDRRGPVGAVLRGVGKARRSRSTGAKSWQHQFMSPSHDMAATLAPCTFVGFLA